MEKRSPQNIEAEQSVLGSVFVEQSVIKTIIDKLDVNDFYHYRHRVIFAAILELFKEGIDVDYTTLSDKIEKQGLIKEAGGLEYIVGLINSVPSISNLDNYVNIVKDKSITRKIIDTCKEIIDGAYTVDNTMEFVDSAEKRIFDITKYKRTSGFINIGSVTEDVIRKIELTERNRGKITGLDTGFLDLNNFTLGLQPSELIIIAARPSIGKSAFALNIATNVAKSTKKPSVAFFSLEMGVDQLVGRMLSSESQVESMKIRSGNLSSMEWQQINVGRESLSNLNIYFDDSGTVKVTDLRSKCRKLNQEGKLDIVIIDYLQLLSGSSKSNTNRVQEVSEISRILKETARELKIPVIALSQLSRNVENRNDKVPVMADLRESGSIEQDADIVMFLYRDDYYDENSEKKDIVDIILAKNRQGSVGRFELLFKKETSTFQNKSRSFYDTQSQNTNDLEDL